MKHFILIPSIILVLILCFAALAQKPSADSREARIQRAMEMREELHRRLIEHMFKGTGSTEDIFKDMDSLFEDVMSDMNSHFGERSSTADAYEMAWTESKEGRTLLLSPKNKEQRLEINVDQGMISIKGKTEHKFGQSTSISSFSHSYSIPQDCDGTKVKMLEKEGKILMIFPYKSASTSQESSPKKSIEPRIPVKPSDQDVAI
jgi:hypothetical protein